MITFYFIIFLLGTLAGFITGLLGVGGGIIIIPAFLFILPFIGFDTISVNKVTGIAATQGMLGSFFAYLSFKKNNNIKKDILPRLLILVAISSLLGAIVSCFINEKILLFIYAAILCASAILFITDNSKNSKVNLEFNILPPVLIFIIGFFAGALGLGGAILYIPVLTYFYNMKIKESIANVTLMVFVTSSSSFIGKTITNQVPFELILPILLGSIIGAKLGTRVNSKLPSVLLKGLLLSIIVLTLLRVVFSLMQ